MYIHVSLRNIVDFSNGDITSVALQLKAKIDAEDAILVAAIKGINPRFNISNVQTLEEYKASVCKEWKKVQTYSFIRHKGKDLCDKLGTLLQISIEDMGIVLGEHPYKSTIMMPGCHLYIKCEGFQVQNRAICTKDEIKIKIFEDILNKFETAEVRLYCQDMIMLMPDYIFTMASSTSGKYHNIEQCSLYGQVNHIYSFAYIMNTLLELEYNMAKFNKPIQRDLLRCTPILHDAWKCGIEGSTYSIADHPKVAADWIRTTNVAHMLDRSYINYLADLVESHSGQWNKDKAGKVIMNKPTTDAQLLVHECDMISSRHDLHYNLPEHILTLLKTSKFSQYPHSSVLIAEKTRKG